MSQRMPAATATANAARTALTDFRKRREYVEVPRGLVKNTNDYFALTVKGDDLVDDGLLAGDVVVIKRQAQAQDGQTIMAILKDEATIKKYFNREGQIELHSAKRDHGVIKVTDDKEFKILGVLSSVIRKME